MESRAAVDEPPISCTNMTRARMIPAQISRLFIQLLTDGSLSEPPFCCVRWPSAMVAASSLSICPALDARGRPSPIGFAGAQRQHALAERLDRERGARCNVREMWLMGD